MSSSVFAVVTTRSAYSISFFAMRSWCGKFVVSVGFESIWIPIYMPLACSVRCLPLCSQLAVGSSAGHAPQGHAASSFLWEENRLIRVLQRGQDILGDLVDELRAPEGVSHVVVDHSHVPHVEGHVVFVG